MPLKICHISDTHLQKFPELPEADILVHSGDALNYGSFEDLIDFRRQLEAVKDKYSKIIYVAGNHDRVFESNPHTAKTFLLETVPNLVYLHDESYEYKGYKIHGTPFQPFFCNWSFNVKDNLKLYEMYMAIPEDTQILITHCPPEGILDRNQYSERCGSRALSLAIPHLDKLKLHMFGHIHGSAGVDYLLDVWYSNAAICDEQYKPTNPPRIIELA
jgi:Icc-related predicted phosphoesterase